MASPQLVREAVTTALPSRRLVKTAVTVPQPAPERGKDSATDQKRRRQKTAPIPEAELVIEGIDRLTSALRRRAGNRRISTSGGAMTGGLLDGCRGGAMSSPSTAPGNYYSPTGKSGGCPRTMTITSSPSW